jgi:hypothetical protein
MNNSNFFKNETIKLIVSDLRSKLKNFSLSKLKKHGFKNSIPYDINENSSLSPRPIGKYDLDSFAIIIGFIGLLVNSG